MVGGRFYSRTLARSGGCSAARFKSVPQSCNELTSVYTARYGGSKILRRAGTAAKRTAAAYATRFLSFFCMAERNEKPSLASGLYAALVTPRRADSLEADAAALLEYLDAVTAAGVDGLVLFGSTGEFVHFESEE